MNGEDWMLKQLLAYGAKPDLQVKNTVFETLDFQTGDKQVTNT